MRIVIFLTASLVIVALAAMVIMWSGFNVYMTSAGGSNALIHTIVVPNNATPEAVVRLLAQYGLIQNPKWLQFYAEHLATGLKVVPGEYALAPTMSPLEQLKKIAGGKVMLHAVVVPPGAEVADVARILAEQKLGNEADLVHFARDRRSAVALHVAGSELEGFLFPGTYELPRNLSPTELLGPMIARYKENVTPKMLALANKRGLNEHDLITLASLVEKAAGSVAEQKKYASILRRRLASRLPLKVSASVAYGQRRLGEAHTKSTNQARHPWDTERVPGLPQTPIGSPSLSAIRAVLESTETDSSSSADQGSATPCTTCKDDSSKKDRRKRNKKGRRHKRSEEG